MHRESTRQASTLTLESQPNTAETSLPAIALRAARTHALVALAWLAFGAGIYLRFDYALVHHHLRHFASSDAAAYVAHAHVLLEEGARVRLGDTIWPPGTAALWATLIAVEPSLIAAAWWNALASLGVLLLTAASARLLAGAIAGRLALILAALHPGFIHYSGYLLAEQPFQFAQALAIFLSLLALVTLERAPGASWFAGPAVGFAWGLAALFRGNALPVAVCTGLALAIHFARRRERHALWLGAGAALALGAVLLFAAHRCTAVAGGRSCLVSNNVAMNIALGQAGPRLGLEFRDARAPEETTGWVPPALLHLGYQGSGVVPASIYDTRGVMRWVGQRFVEDPGSFVVRAIGNALDLFGLNYWPDAYGSWGERATRVWKQLWSAIVFVPAVYCLPRMLRVARRRGPSQSLAIFVLAALCGLLASAAISLGEARYRMPFDGLFIALASAVYARVRWPAQRPAAAQAPANAKLRWHWPLCAAAIGGAALGLIALSHPAWKLGPSLPQRQTAWRFGASAATAAPGAYAVERDRGAVWNDPRNYVWRCTPNCRELRLPLLAPVSAGQALTVSLDHNDRYRLLFYRAGVVLGTHDVPPAHDVPTGLQVVSLPRLAAGTDTIGVQPLHGDGHYSLGHVRVR